MDNAGRLLATSSGFAHGAWRLLLGAIVTAVSAKGSSVVAGLAGLN
jgi:hypothetical protein